MASIFTELALVLVISFVISLMMHKVKQPLLVGYIVTGVVAGPVFFNLLSNPENYEVFSHIGIAFLLFIVGLQLNIKLVKEVGVISVVTGIGQIVFTTLFGILIATSMGVPLLQAGLIAVALTFSSTIIIVKLLSDSKGLEELYGKISLGFLLVQDFVAVIILMVISALTQDGGSTETIILTVGWGVLMVLIVFLASRFFIESLLHKISTFKELNFLFMLSWCFGISVLFERIGFSLEIGALLAGVTLASTSYQQEIAARIRPLRDFFIILFFIFLGSQLIPVPSDGIIEGDQWSYMVSSIGDLLPQAIVYSLFVIIGNPLIVLLLVTFFGYSARTGFLAGLTVSQISEFSIILVLLGQKAGLITESVVSLITLVAIITITCSTYMVVYGERLYKAMRPLLLRFEKDKVKDALQGVQGKEHEVGVFGYRRIGPHALKQLTSRGVRCLVVDHDPLVVDKLKEKGVEVVFGDVSNAEFLSEFDFVHMKLVISTIPNYNINKSLLDHYKRINPKGHVILVANEMDQAADLYQNGADYVIVPHHLGANHVEDVLKEYMQQTHHLAKVRKKHLKSIKKEKEYQ